MGPLCFRLEIAGRLFGALCMDDQGLSEENRECEETPKDLPVVFFL